MLRRWKEEDAVSPVIATVILVAIAVVLAGVVFAVYGSAGSRERPVALALTQGSTSSDTQRTFDVAASTPGVRYDRISILLAGDTIAYDGALASDGTWCQETPYGACVPTSEFDQGSSISAGDRLRIRAATFTGETLTLRDDVANALLASIELR